MIKDENKLDNPVWFSLTESHAKFSVGHAEVSDHAQVCNHAQVKFYHPDYCPFGGYLNLDSTEKHLKDYSELSASFYVVGEQPNYPASLTLNKDLVCLQMVLSDKIEVDIVEAIIPLKAEQKADLLRLVNLVQPGYFKDKTPELGNYYGIYKDNQLVAVTGERMNMDAYTEVSAVVTHPEHTGKGYAKQLVAHTSKQILLENKTPYLHVAESNTGAIKLYEKLGFVTRRKISFWNFIRSQS
ncbi:acetyltransferase [Pedobacter sp. PACM 27299]|uniref:GNAT family N-acetyltransferase n=1 Tax=Pedobacter sp. PACM 27299 TaxID=1727164 RepID=UPI0007068AB1|nr:GNAT family N-acetyltransferase [Pedobacter sp. PACM 27299]ALL05993.1 acetyltransferase [Pedobacter sp. PACM 27299]